MNNTRKIKIAQVITRMDWGGSPDVLRIICQNFDPEIYDLWIFIGRTKHPTDKTRLFLDAFKERITFIAELRREVNLWKDWQAFWKLFGKFKQERFDIVHTHTAKAGALGRLAAKMAGIPVIIHTPHGHNFYGYFNGFISRVIILIEKVLAVFTDRLIALTELEKQDYLKFRVADEQKTVLVYIGLELDKFLANNANKVKGSFSINNREKVVGYVGRLDPIKGAQFFVEAARLCLQKNTALKFILVGEGILRKELEVKVTLWGLNDKIVFTGWRDDIPDIMSILDILVLPSLNEAVGIVLIEAQSLGVPVVASNVGGIAEIIKDKQTGILVEPADPQAIAEAVKELLDNPQKMLAMSDAAKNRVKDRFKAENMVQATLNIYQDVLKEKNVSI